MKFKVTSTPASETVEVIVEAKNEDEAWENYFNETNIISKKVIVHDDGYVDVEKLESEVTE